MTESIILPAPALGTSAMPRTKWEREYRTFCRLLPQLLTSHNGQYVAIHDAQVVDSSDDRMALALRVLHRIGNVPIHIGLVTQRPEPVSRSGVRREVRAIHI